MTAALLVLAGFAAGVLARSELARRAAARATASSRRVHDRDLDQLLDQYGWRHP